MNRYPVSVYIIIALSTFDFKFRQSRMKDRLALGQMRWYYVQISFKSTNKYLWKKLGIFNHKNLLSQSSDDGFKQSNLDFTIGLKNKIMPHPTWKYLCLAFSIALPPCLPPKNSFDLCNPVFTFLVILFWAKKGTAFSTVCGERQKNVQYCMWAESHWASVEHFRYAQKKPEEQASNKTTEKLFNVCKLFLWCAHQQKNLMMSACARDRQTTTMSCRLTASCITTITIPLKNTVFLGNPGMRTNIYSAIAT